MPFLGKIHPVRPDKDFFEITAWQKGNLVYGVDEAGRGCLAGPVVAAAAALRPKSTHNLLRDSKLMSKKQRNEAFDWIAQNGWYGVGIVDNKAIDTINIYQATKIAMARAISQLSAITPKPPKFIIVDAMPLDIPDRIAKTAELHSFTKCESLSSSVAAASIVAKVTRDRLMGHFDTVVPGYDLGKHSGYGTKAHQCGITSLGLSIIHRLSFKIKGDEGERTESGDKAKQHSIFG